MSTAAGKIVNVVGFVDSARTSKKPSELEIYCPTSRKKYLLLCDFFCPAKERDAFTATCRYMQDGGPTQKIAATLLVINPPLVQIPSDRESVIRCFIQVLNKTGFGERRAAALYDHLENLARAEREVKERSREKEAEEKNPAPRPGKKDELVVLYLSQMALGLTQWGDEGLLVGHMPHATPEQMSKLLFWWQKNYDMRRLYLLGLTRQEIRASGLETEELYLRCLANPYTVASLSMEKCTQILLRQGRKPTASDVECGLILRLVWENMTRRQWAATPEWMVVRKFPQVKTLYPRLEAEYDLRRDRECLFMRKALEVETKIASYLTKLMEVDSRVQGILNALEESQEQEEVGTVAPNGEPMLRAGAFVSGIALSSDQEAAIQAALERKVCIITGGAGSGKTTVIGEIVKNLELREEAYAVCSFTGKAVSRVKQVLGKGRAARVSTIHRMIMRAKSPTAEAKFRTLIIDEASMVTCELFLQLVEAYPHEFRLIMVGDVNQLPPIGWGSFFAQCIAAKTFPTFYLSVNHRVYQVEGEEDGILGNAKKILSHTEGSFQFTETKNFGIFSGEGLPKVFEIIKMCHQVGIPQEELILLTPYNKDLPALNACFQQTYNEETRSTVDPQGVLWHVGDRVRMKENNYEINVMNGELGIVKNLTGDALIVDFGESGIHDFKLKIPPKTWGFEPGADGESGGKSQTVEYIDHAYAISVHRYQGSEADFVIVYVPPGQTGSFLNKNLLYTALTRAKRALWVVGDEVGLAKAAVTRGPVRYEYLGARLKESLPPVVTEQREEECECAEPEEDFGADFDEWLETCRKDF